LKEKAILKTEDRNFFTLVNQALLSNPFLEERTEVIARILSDFAEERKKEKSKLKAFLPELNERMGRLEQRGYTQIQSFKKEEDREIIGNAFLLQVYLGCISQLNELIQEQLNLGGTPVNVPFATNVITQLKARGFSKEECLHYFALFYQLRRAFYFIDKALVGDSPSMKKLRLALWNNVFTCDVNIYDKHLWNRMEDFSTILEGETGTGKGSAAAAIGRSGFIPFDLKKGQFSHNFTETFITINLSQYPESLIESELFGHYKGAFTGAVANHEGLFERCSAHGALFLDEIGEITVPIQIKLLQVLQERTFTPVGSHSLKRFEGRVIAATNRSLEELRRQRDFRDDFFYRLCSDVITVPTLRQRIEESPSELEQMVNLLFTRMTGQANPKLKDMILETFQRDLPPGYRWPGNVRELEQAIRRVLMTQRYEGDDIFTKSNLDEEFMQRILEGTLKSRELVSQYCTLIYKRFGTYQEVARRTGLDRRTVKSYLQGKTG